MIYCRSGRQKTEKRKTFSVIYNNFFESHVKPIEAINVIVMVAANIIYKNI